MSDDQIIEQYSREDGLQYGNIETPKIPKHVREFDDDADHESPYPGTKDVENANKADLRYKYNGLKNHYK